MCRDFLTNYRCGHRFTATRERCFYETQRHESQPICRFITVCYSRWDEDGETHCVDCREEIRKARPGRILTAKREQLEAYELGIAEYTRDINDQEEEFRRLGAGDDVPLVESSTESGDKTSSSGEATPLTHATSTDEPLSPKANALLHSPNEDESFERELSAYEIELLKQKETRFWTERVEDDVEIEESKLSGNSAEAQPASEVEEHEGPSMERLDRRLQEMHIAIDAKEDAEKKIRKEKVAELKSMFAAAREKADKLDRAEKVTRLQTMFAEARLKATLLEKK